MNDVNISTKKKTSYSDYTFLQSIKKHNNFYSYASTYIKSQLIIHAIRQKEGNNSTSRWTIASQ